MEKNRAKAVGRGHVTYFWHFGTPSISRERFELETSNLACRFITRGTNDKNEKFRQRSSGSGHVTYFWNYGTPSLSRKRFELDTSNLACRLSIMDTNYESEKLCQKGTERGHKILLKFCKPPSYLENGLSEKLQILHADWNTWGNNDKN